MSGLSRIPGGSGVAVGRAATGEAAGLIGVSVDSVGSVFCTDPATNGGSEVGSGVESGSAPGFCGFSTIGSGETSGSGARPALGVGDSAATVSEGVLATEAVGFDFLRVDLGRGVGVAAGVGAGVGVTFFLKILWKNPGDLVFSTGKARRMTGVGVGVAA